MRESGRNKLELKSSSNIYCMEIDAQGRVFAVVVTSAYPIRHIFSSSSQSAAAHSQPRLMWDFASHVTRTYPHESVASPPGGLKRSLKPFLRDLAVKYDDLDAIDKIATVAGKLDSLRSTMASNLAMADERQSLLERGERGGRDLEGAARRQFQRGAALSHRRRCCGCTWWCCQCSCLSATVLAFLVLVIVAAVVLSLNYTKLHWWR